MKNQVNSGAVSQSSLVRIPFQAWVFEEEIKQGISQHLQHLLNFLSMRVLFVFFKPVQFHTGDIYEGFCPF